jgi:hypothetical protein
MQDGGSQTGSNFSFFIDVIETKFYRLCQFLEQTDSMDSMQPPSPDIDRHRKSWMTVTKPEVA